MTTIEAKMVPVHGAELATEAWGRDERGTILLAMGATASMVWWPDALMTALVEGGYRVIRFDHRDTGGSTTGAPGEVGYDVFDLADDLVAILDAYGVELAHVMGMSLGAYVAQIAAMQAPERVLSLTMLAAEPLGMTYEGEGIDPELMTHFGAMAELDWADRAAVTAFMLRIAELSAGKGRPFDRAAALERIGRELDRASSMQSAFNHAMVGGELPEGMTAAALDLPVLVIHGGDDPVISVRAAEASAAAIEGAELLVLEGVGHELVAADVPVIAEAVLRLAAG
ncbi:MAG: alpha/beta fold hydrolase [Devosia sp.]